MAGLLPSYQITHFNVLKHGILARRVVLPHEEAGEFADLLAALVEKHQPTGPPKRIGWRN